MVKTLYLLRHAKATSEPYDRDAKRPLAERGRKDAADCAQWIEAQKLRCDTALISPSERTRQSWELLADAIAPTTNEVVDALYLASLQELTELLHAQSDDTQSLLLLGHNPGLYELAMYLAPDRTLDHGFPTCALAVIELPIESWGLAVEGCGHLQHCWTPKRGDMAA